jgi:hypothetical protein
LADKFSLSDFVVWIQANPSGVFSVTLNEDFKPITPAECALLLIPDWAEEYIPTPLRDFAEVTPIEEEDEEVLLVRSIYT